MTAVGIRAAMMDDLPFIDALQKQHARQVGFLPRAALEGKIRLGQMLIAEAVVGCQLSVVSGEANHRTLDPQPTTNNPQITTTPIGYLIAADRYFKRDEVGYITQINVLPEYRRSLVAAQLLSAQFERSAYGCKLYSCWCAQDLAANHFWEAMGFTAIAFRTGARGKMKADDGTAVPRIHIFWQKRIRENDTGDVTAGGTPFWYPCVTNGGEMRQDRVAFPIPPGVHWSDVLPVVLPESSREPIAMSGTAEDVGGGEITRSNGQHSNTAEAKPKLARRKTVKVATHTKPPGVVNKMGWFSLETQAEIKAMNAAIGALHANEPGAAEAAAAIGLTISYDNVPGWGRRLKPRKPGPAVKGKAAAGMKLAGMKLGPKQDKPPAEKKLDARLALMARELRDKWGEQLAIHPAVMMQSAGKYDLRRGKNTGALGCNGTPLRIAAIEPAQERASARAG